VVSHIRYPALYTEILSRSLRSAFAFRANLAAEVLASVINVVSSLAIVRSVFWIAGSLQGWSQGEATALLGCYLIGSGVLGACVEPNLREFREQIVRGDLDETLLRPVSSAFLVSLGSCAPFVLSQAVAGAIVLVMGLRGLERMPTLPAFLLAASLFLTGCLAVWAIRLMLASLAFWAPAAQPEVGFRAFWEFGRYPGTVYVRPLRLILTCIVPVALVTTVPAQVLSGEAGWRTIGTALLVCGVLMATTRLVWRAGLRRYTSATS
jgi:ABC-2 type transport system permease protein